MAVKAMGKTRAVAKKATAPTKKASGTRAGGRRAAGRLHYCAAPPAPVRQFAPEVMGNPTRLRAIIASASKWMNHTVLRYAFFKTRPWNVPAEQAAVIHK